MKEDMKKKGGRFCDDEERAETLSSSLMMNYSRHMAPLAVMK